jgi:hypothetical protein
VALPTRGTSSYALAGPTRRILLAVRTYTSTATALYSVYMYRTSSRSSYSCI